jgi:hypothetical protein
MYTDKVQILGLIFEVAIVVSKEIEEEYSHKWEVQVWEVRVSKRGKKIKSQLNFHDS